MTLSANHSHFGFTPTQPVHFAPTPVLHPHLYSQSLDGAHRMGSPDARAVHASAAPSAPTRAKAGCARPVHEEGGKAEEKERQDPLVEGRWSRGGEPVDASGLIQARLR